MYVIIISQFKTHQISYLKDLFFYQLVYDPNQKTLNADRGEIRVGSKYQADVPSQTLLNNGVDLSEEGSAVM
jgi:hypothetical protein